MNNRQLGLRFSETMTGGVALGETDYGEGERKGRPAGNILAIHVTITINDVMSFIECPEHEGQMSGNIDYPPFGSAIPCGSGRFNLFSPSNDPQMKLMIYELGFVHENQAYYLAGRKEIRNDHGFDMWRDTTTLLVHLYAGSDSSGDIIAAGTLKIRFTEFIHMLSSMQVLGDESLQDKVMTLGRFGKFFLGELWDTYARYPNLNRS